MSPQQIAPYGSWKSPITSELIVSGSIGIGGVVLDGDLLYWVEGRPSEGGRYVIVQRTPAGETTDVNPPPFNARTRVHEYGGGAYFVAEGIVYFSNFADQRIYRQKVGEQPQPLTPEGDYRYADAILDRPHHRLICVREDHTGEGEPQNTIVSIDLDTGECQVLVSGDDFYASPRLSPEGSQLCWLSWNHPNLPWDGTELFTASLQADGSLDKPQLVAGGVSESIFQPEWSPDGLLYFVSDRDNWWNLYHYRDGKIEPLCPKEAEFGLPLWVFGMATYTFASADEIICTYTEAGNWFLASLDVQTGQLQTIETPYSSISAPLVSQGKAIFTGGSATEPTAIVQLDLASGEVEVIRQSTRLKVEEGYLSIPQPIEFPTENGLTAYGFFYPPTNQDFRAPEGTKPPLLVKSHGGPTAATSSTFNLKIQYWTSRGFAVLDVNYGGSTGYGREYRQRLKERWGIVDVDDCANGAKYLAQQGLVDGDKLAIAGGSAGGYTTLAALTFRDVFKAGASHYGVSDLEALATDTHKFESRYLDGLIGPYPERQDLYIARSPIHHTDRLACPAIFFQGLEDKIVPPNQAEAMVNAIKAKGLPVAYITFAEEQHGFRKAENIQRSLDGEFYFYARIFGFEPAESIEPIPIENL
ncbi:S9 family peptidase [Desertifilum sp. FACHB-1129]|uniref:Peptidase n=1 Tax=Desertifilum tharense IPPAS B-1220 TaxID=1781255 RepID=A0A1E5QJC6_9CYAN|nr:MULTISPECIES: S9 family peptidase [Desertifilum]MDA0211548.1 S9 family peptidase [Cyanobacteria bacterium FC1]MBD2310072.1 S9 family peptidase [Desertifilum sp. FACHB-1129]MBD2322124.1 S9 family peptidase [Desertifilum sp. FACHB-866]MBD2333797.1 S9 family peptidase [Desertifilum sp. FACHB-868]OEJ74760.1 peptidase [Desertifilum tharense IPPAS B-1220]